MNQPNSKTPTTTMANNLSWALVWSSWAVLSVCVASAKGVHHAAAAAAAAAPAPATDCSSALISLVDCLSYVQEGSKVGKPQGQCCPGLKKVVKDEASCLCEAFKRGAEYGVKLNMTRALSLPSACGVTTPPFSECNIAVAPPGAAPVSAPAGAPSASSTTGQSDARAPAPSPMHSAGASFPPSSLALLLTIIAALFCNHP